MFWPRLRRPERLAPISMRVRELVATQTLMFLFAGYHRLIRAGLAAHGR